MTSSDNVIISNKNLKKDAASQFLVNNSEYDVIMILAHEFVYVCTKFSYLCASAWMCVQMFIP